MLNAKSSENFRSPDQNWANFGGFGGLMVRGYKKFRFLLQKAHVFVNPRRLHGELSANNLEQVANLLCAQANSASYPQRDGK